MAAKVVNISETTKHFLFFYLFIYKNLALEEALNS